MRSLVEKFEDKPFAIVGINSDRSPDELRRVIKEQRLTWRSFFDGGTPGGPIAARWHVKTVRNYVLDHEGIIRAVSPKRKDLDQLLEKLVDAVPR